MIQRTPLAFWHLPEWERVCQEKINHHFPATQIWCFFLKSPPTTLCSSPWWALMFLQQSRSCCSIWGQDLSFLAVCLWNRSLNPQQVLPPLPWIGGRCRPLEPCWETPGSYRLRTGLSWTSYRPVDREKLWREGRCALPKGGRIEQILNQNLTGNFFQLIPAIIFPTAKLIWKIISMRQKAASSRLTSQRS